VQDAASLRVEAAGPDLGLPGTFALSEVRISGVDTQRYLELPGPDPEIPVDAVTLNRDPDRSPCVLVENALPCDDLLVSPGEDGDTLARRFTLPFADSYRITGSVSLRRSVDASGLLRSPAGAFSDGDRPADVAEGPMAARDGDLATTWRTTEDGETLQVRLFDKRPVSELQVVVNPAAPVSRPTLVRFRSGTRSIDLALDDDGRAELPKTWTVSRFSLQVLQVDSAFSIQGQEFVPLDAGISDLRLDGRSLKPHPAHLRAFPCGSGPDLEIGGRTVLTSLRASTLALIRGRSVPLQACGSEVVALGADTTEVVAEPNALFRVDTLSLVRESAQPSAATSLDVRRDAGGTPVSVDLPTRSGPSVLVLPQNDNDGWVATIDGRALRSQRVDGWKQGWVVPGGAAATVRFEYQPETTFRIALGAGAALLVLCLLGAGLRPRRSVRELAPLPALRAGPVGPLDVVVVLAVGGLLVGWYGLGAVALALVAGLAVRRFDGWGAAAGAAMLVAGAGLSWDRITQATWANEWRQGWSLLAVACLVAALASALTRPRRFRGRSRASAPAPGPAREAPSGRRTAGSSAAGSASRTGSTTRSPGPGSPQR